MTSFRTFYINSYFGGCTLDEGWLVVVDGVDLCPWASSSSYPTFLYALGSQKLAWSDGKISSTTQHEDLHTFQQNSTRA